MPNVKQEYIQKRRKSQYFQIFGENLEVLKNISLVQTTPMSPI
jgi:hypothetical protein